MTLKELYSLVNGEKTDGRISFGELMNRQEDVLVKDILTSNSVISTLTVFRNGYVLYQEDKRRTIFHISEVVGKDFIYGTSLMDVPDIEERRITKEELLASDWKTALYMVGNERIEENRGKTESYHIAFRFDDTLDETREKYLSYTPDFNKAFEKTLELQRIKEVIDLVRSKLTEAEWNTYFNVEVLGMHQDDIARKEGISQQAVSKRYLKACRTIERYRDEFIDKYYED